MMVAILVLATLVTRRRSQTGKSVSVSAQCALVFPFSVVKYPSLQKWFLNSPGHFFVKFWPFFSHNFVECVMFTSLKIAGNNKV